MKYCWEFFETEDKAKQYQKELGKGILYCSEGETKESYESTCNMAEVIEDFKNNHPFVVCWNE